MGSKLTDFNDVVCIEGHGAVKEAIDGAIQPQPDPSSVRKEDIVDDQRTAFAVWDQRIDGCEDAFELANVIYPELAASTLNTINATILGKKISKKINVSWDVLQGGGGKGERVTIPPSTETSIAELNEHHAVVPMGGGVFIVNRDFDPILNRYLLSFSTEAHFKLRYRNRRVAGSDGLIGLGDYWLDHPDRRTYEGLVFAPEDEVDGYMNLWLGWGCEPIEGECPLWLKFCREIICNGDNDLFVYVLRYFAHLVQKPQELPEIALVLRGKQGVGKNTFFDAIGRIVGKTHFIMLSSMNQIVGRFAGHLCDVLFVVCNEGVWGGNKDAQGVLKSLVTDHYQPMEKKGKDIVTVRNLKRVLFSTNGQWAVPRDMDDRRHIVLDVSDAQKEQYAYWAAIKKEMDNGGVEALFWKLKHMDITGWHPRQVPAPMKQAGYEMKIMGADSPERWWMEMLMRGWITQQTPSFAEDKNHEWPQYLRMEDLQKSYLHWCVEYKVTHPDHPLVVGKALKAFGCKIIRPRLDNQARGRVYVIPGIHEARNIFSSLFNLPASVWEGEIQETTP